MKYMEDPRSALRSEAQSQQQHQREGASEALQCGHERMFASLGDMTEGGTMGSCVNCGEGSRTVRPRRQRKLNSSRQTSAARHKQIETERKAEG